jgi:hypothetical protein
VPNAEELALETAVIVTGRGFADWSVGALLGAKNKPVLEMNPVVRLPPVTLFTCHVTAVFDVPVTVALNCMVPNTFTEGAGSFTVTVILLLTTVPGLGPLQAANAKTIAKQNAQMSERRIIPPSNGCPQQS